MTTETNTTSTQAITPVETIAATETTVSTKELPLAADYLAFVKKNDREGADAFLKENFGIVGTESYDEKGLAKFTEMVLNLVDVEAMAAMNKKRRECQ